MAGLEWPTTIVVVATADAGNTVPEFVDGNNAGVSSEIAVTTPDLRVASVAVPPTVVRGAALNVVASIENIGTADAGATNVRIRVLSVPSGTELASVTLAQAVVTAGSSISLNNSFTTTLDWPATVAVEVTTDHGNAIFELSEFNNVGISDPIGLTIPNLLVSSIAVPPSVPRGSELSVTATIQNNGSADAGATDARIRVRAVGSGEVLGEAIVAQGAVGAGASTTVTAAFTAAMAWPTPVVVEVNTDFSSVVAESSESDNTNVSNEVPITIPDLTISSLTLSTQTVVLRCALGIQILVQNNGNGQAAATNLRVSLRDLLGNVFATTTLTQPAIGGNASATLNASFTAATTWPAEFNVLAESDFGATVPEADESNNSANNGSTTVKTRLTVPAGFHKMWTCGNSNSWTDGSNWEPAGAPLTTHTVFIPNGVPVYPLVSTNQNIAGLTVESAAFVEIAASTMLLTTGDVQGGEVRGAGVLRMTNSRLLRGRVPNLEVFGTTLLNGGTRAGSVFINGGTALVTPNLNLSGQTMTVDGNFVIGAGTSVSSHLTMLVPTGMLDIGGNMTVNSRSNLQQGQITLRGNFMQAGDDLAFRPGGTKVVFDGSAAQSVSFAGGSSNFDAVEIRNSAGVNFATDVWVAGQLTVASGGRVTQAPEFNTFYTLRVPEEMSPGGYRVASSVVAGSVVLVRNVSLGWPDANVAVNGGTAFGTPNLNLNGFTLQIAGDFAILPGTSVSSHLSVNAASSRLEVGGDMSLNSRSSLTLGTIVLRGNFSQGGDALALRPAGAKFVFDGSAQQNVSFTDAGQSWFDDVDVLTPASAGGVNFTTDVVVTGELVAASGALVTQSAGSTIYTTRVPEELGPNAYRVPTSRIGAAVVLIKNIRLANPDANFVVNGGTALGTPSLNLNAFTFAIAGDFTIEPGTSVSSHLHVSAPTSRLEVGGDMTLGSRSGMQAGVIVVRGNFAQNGDALSVRPAGTTIVFEGTAPQTVQFADPGQSWLDEVEIRTPSSAQGVTFGVPGATDVVVTGQLVVHSGSLLKQVAGGSVIYTTRVPDEVDAASYQARTSRVGGPVVMQKNIVLAWPNANFIVNGGTSLATPNLNMNGFDLKIGGSFTIDPGTSVSAHLTMGGGTPELDVGGDMVVASRSSLATGEIIVRGNFRQEGDGLAMRPTGTVMTFAGSGGQTVQFQDAVNSNFLDVNIRTLASGGGVMFGVPGATDVRVIGDFTVHAGALLTQTPGGSIIYTNRMPTEVDPQSYRATSRVGGTVTMQKTSDLSWEKAHVIVNGGSALATPSLNLNGNALRIGGDFTINPGTSVSPHLFMASANPVLEVGGSMSVSSRSTLAVGTVSVKGNLTQAGDALSLRPTGTRFVFNGTSPQTLTINGTPNSWLANTEVSAGSSVSLASNVRMQGNLQLNGALLVPAARALTVTGTLFLAGSLTNDGTVTVGACTNQGGTVSGSGPNPCP